MAGVIGTGMGLRRQAGQGFSRAAGLETQRNRANDQLEAQEKANMYSNIGGGALMGAQMGAAGGPMGVAAGAAGGAIIGGLISTLF